MKKRKLGQGAVEYLFLLAVIASIMVTVLAKVRDYMLDGAENCTADSKSLVCIYSRLFNSVGNEDNNFRYFSIMK